MSTDDLRKHLDARLDRIVEKQDAMDQRQRDFLDKLEAHRVEDENRFGKLWAAVGKLQVKSGVWGLIGGMIPVAVGAVWWLMRMAA